MITNNDIREFLGLPKVEEDFEVEKVDSLGIKANTLMFVNKGNTNIELLEMSHQCVYLLDESYTYEPSQYGNDFIKVKNPKFVFCRVVDHFELKSKFQLDHTYYCGHIEGHSYIKYGVNNRIDEGAIIGGEDFSPVLGASPDELVQFPQMGGVKLGDNVMIKYNSMIGKGTFGYTEIGDNTMIDYGCQIGHNCIIGKACIIAAGTIIGGSTTVGDYTVIGIGAKIRNGLKIGKNVSIGMGSVVIKDVPDHAVVVGNPARIIEHKKIFDEGGLV